ncbi:NAD(P)-dependent oxidoreductase [Croceicoccus marinus]|uniref:NAD(P)-dependent oxidoreductase n=1 Tax=Croceicoccus marinus TaxID=450378 RepID=UPI002FCC92B0
MTDNSDKPVVIVTGSSGYIGSAIVKKLAARYRVIGFDRDAAPHPPAEAECVCVDVTDQASIDAAFERVRTPMAKGSPPSSTLLPISILPVNRTPNMTR